MAQYDLIPVNVPKVNTRFRTIRTSIPVPQSLPIFEELCRSEPRSMSGQPPILWHKADNFTVRDKWGNRWIDWSSGVLITNAGHGRTEIASAVKKLLNRRLLATYVFPHEGRATLTRMLRELSPDPKNYQVFLLSTGSEATENCIKLAKTYAFQKHGPHKKYFVSFHNAFHGRTMGAQLAGGNEKQKTWMVDRDRTFVQVPFPDGYKNKDTSFELFLNSLEQQSVKPQDIAGVMSESFQGVGPDFLPTEYARKLEAFCRQHDIVLIMDEVQSGFGRTGKMFCYEHYGIRPDLIACGKGISSSLPLSAVIGRKDIMDLYAPGSMTSTHSASPLVVAAAIENLNIIKREKLAARAHQLGMILCPELQRIQQKHSQVLGCFQGRGLVAGIQVVKPGTREPDAAMAKKLNLACLYKGLLMFAPVGVAGECLKVAPPLTISDAALRESIAVFEDAMDEVLGS
jgi:4-aminobutyrate aminotransferase-like enzyme